MAFNPGRNVGKLSIRVVPDTTKFRDELKKKLLGIEKSTPMTVQVTRANLDQRKIRDDLKRQMAAMRDLKVDVDIRGKIVDVDQSEIEKIKKVAKIKPTLDSIAVERVRREMSTLLRDVEPKLNDRRIRQQIDVLHDAFERVTGRLAHDIMSPADAERLRERLRRIKDEIEELAEDREMQLHVNPFTAWASARLKWLTRPRVVEIIAKVSQSSVLAALTTLSALSGARLSWKWIDNLIDKAKELDKNLPAIVGWTSGITSLIGGLFAATSGLVGIGEGLFAITPALLVLPGLFLNALGSATALIVALKNANTELSPLKDNMSELGDIINGEFWGRARQPIIDLVQGLMPQLRTAFADLSSGIGDFTAAMADSFGKELSNGRLASIFNGIAEGWRVLATGADGFAGALVSLSNIAAQYTPRLAGWFVRQANTFDKWLKAISEDGRLGTWMEDAIDSMYALWDATRGLAGVFSGIFRAAESAGTGGLRGFADLMLEWRRVVNSANFQQGLEAIFRGSYVAMEAFGDAVEAIGRLVADNSAAFETFIASAGTFLGGLIEGMADALNTPVFNTGLNDLSAGLTKSLDGILAVLPRIGDTFGNFLGLLGDLAGTVIPAAAGVLANLMPAIDSIIGAVRDVLPGLSDALTSIADTLGPAIKDFVDAAGPAFMDVITGLSDALVDLAPSIASLVKVLAELIDALRGWSKDNEDFWNGASDLLAGDGGKSRKQREALLKLDRILPYADDGNPFTVPVRLDMMWNPKHADEASKGIANRFMDGYKRTLKEKGQGAADALYENFKSIKGIPPEVIARIQKQMHEAAGGSGGGGGSSGGGWSFSRGIAESIEQGKPEVESAAERVFDAIRRVFTGGDNGEVEATGRRVPESVAAGMDSNRGATTLAAVALIAGMKAIFSSLDGTVAQSGQSIASGFARGLAAGAPMASLSAMAVVLQASAMFATATAPAAQSGQATSAGFARGITTGSPFVMLSALGMVLQLRAMFASSGQWLVSSGVSTMTGYGSGISLGGVAAVVAASSVRARIVSAVSGVSLFGVGFNLMAGMAAGISAGATVAAVAARAAVQSAVSAAKNAAEIRSPSRLTAREIGGPLIQGVAVGIDKNAAGVRRSMVNAVDMSNVSGRGPILAGRAGRNVQLHIHNPVVGDLIRETQDAADMASVLA